MPVTTPHPTATVPRRNGILGRARSLARRFPSGRLFTLLLSVASLATATRTLPAQEPGSNLRISVITIGPGAQVWERFGHNAIMLEDTHTGQAVWYNYGMFDFGATDFWPRFMKGDMRYWMQGGQVRLELPFYFQSNRTVWAQELDIEPAQRLEIKRFLEWNALPENKFYHYDYFRDNCSTRVRDAVDRVIGGAIREQTQDIPAGTTFRSETRRLTESSLPVYVGIELGLARPTDRPISRYEEMFLPMALHRYLRDVTVTGADGKSHPLVKSERTLYTSTATPPPAEPPTWWPWFLLAGLIVGGALYAMSGSFEKSAPARTGFLLLGGAWTLFAGLGGLVLAALWGLTDHSATYYNENLLQLSPVALLLAFTLRRVAWRSRKPHRVAERLAMFVAVSSLVGLALKLLPGPSQVNWEIIAFALPVNLGLAAAVIARRSRRHKLPDEIA
ncbi:MAG TPA: DUF4105 domain-containing protein [Gemmatimonadaceae bacterium]|nr:DUF4105 domain-containing protein [Gemmatimonadaceae bacterium]